MAGRRLHPRRGAVLRVSLITLAFAAAAAAADALWDGNYMYLRSVPGSGSLLSLMGPWPWYLATTTLLAIAVLMLLDMPFWRERRRVAAGDVSGQRPARA